MGSIGSGSSIACSLISFEIAWRRGLGSAPSARAISRASCLAWARRLASNADQSSYTTGMWDVIRVRILRVR